MRELKTFERYKVLDLSYLLLFFSTLSFICMQDLAENASSQKNTNVPGAHARLIALHYTIKSTCSCQVYCTYLIHQICCRKY